jgi:DNA replication protein DnaC
MGLIRLAKTYTPERLEAACERALATNACRIGHTVLYQRLPRLLEEISLARADGCCPTLMSKIAKCQLLVLDDWGLTPMTTAD